MTTRMSPAATEPAGGRAPYDSDKRRVACSDRRRCKRRGQPGDLHTLDERARSFAETLKRMGGIGAREPGPDMPGMRELGGGRAKPGDPCAHGGTLGRPASRPPGAMAEDVSERDGEIGLPTPFSPPVAALLPPPSLGAAAEATPTARSLAEVAAIADRLVTSMRVGRIGREGHALCMRLDLGAGRTLGVELTLRGDELEVQLDPEGGSGAELRQIATTLEEELDAPVTLR